MKKRLTWPRSLLLATCPLVGLALTSDAEAQPQHRWRHYHRSAPQQYCPPSYPSPYDSIAPMPGVPTPAAPLGPDGRPMRPMDPTQPDQTSPSDQPFQDPMTDNLLDQQAQDQAPAAAPAPSTVASAPSSAAPNMVGDSFGSCSTVIFGDPFPDDFTAIPVCPGGGRRFKIGSNQSPLPQHRVFFNYQYFDDALRVSRFNDFDTPTPDIESQDIDVNRYTVGGEALIWRNIASIQLQVPIISTLDSTIVGFDDDTIGDPLPAGKDTQLGNIALALKVLLYRDCCVAYSAGLGIDLPTADDIFFENDSDESIFVENETVTLSPFVGMLYTPNSRFFAQGFAQASLPTNGNTVTRRDLPGPDMVGELDEQSQLYLDLAVGYWLYKNCCCNSVRGLAPIAELHYTTNLEDGDPLVFEDDESIIVPNDADFLNLTLGAIVALGNTQVRPAAVIPLSDDDDKPFDYEFTVQINQFF